ncbi:hypothetical protein KR018_009918 [Drosophila ironensis]|nr:hypothetical protein KR018_009918 [Drosophila ironensis]
MIGEIEDKDTFYDCRSDDEDLQDLGLAHGDAVVCKKAPRFDDPVQIRAVLERAATATLKLLRCYGGTENVVPRPSLTHFYPATLELIARLHTDDHCSCPKKRQFKLTGDPVMLKLPIELNPKSCQVKVNIFQPKSMTTISGFSPVPDDRNKLKKRKTNQHCVRWGGKDDFGPFCEDRLKI